MREMQCQAPGRTAQGLPGGSPRRRLQPGADCPLRDRHPRQRVGGAERRRGDLNESALRSIYDAADRLQRAERRRDEALETASLPGVPTSFDFTYDAVNNLLSKEETALCSVERTEVSLYRPQCSQHSTAEIGT